MITTVTMNPSLDRTVQLTSALEPGNVHRVDADTTQPGGKGINVSLGVHRAGRETRALFPSDASDPLRELVEAAGVPYSSTDLGAAVRTNLTVVDADGVTTKINEPGPQVDPERARAFLDLVLHAITPGDRLMISGSLAPGFAPDTYATIVHHARSLGAWVGVDTSDAPLHALAETFPSAAPHFLKPNAHEIGMLVGADGHALETAATNGDYSDAAEAAQGLRRKGVHTILLTLGSAGALLACDEGVFVAHSVEAEVRSTVGAGDSATAGFLLALDEGPAHPAEALARAAAYGTAAVTLPGTTIPTPEQAHPYLPTVTPL